MHFHLSPFSFQICSPSFLKKRSKEPRSRAAGFFTRRDMPLSPGVSRHPFLCLGNHGAGMPNRETKATTLQPRYSKWARGPQGSLGTASWTLVSRLRLTRSPIFRFPLPLPGDAFQLADFGWLSLAHSQFLLYVDDSRK